MLANQRHQFILEELEKKGSVSTNDLIESLGVSPATIRNDLTFLQSKKLLKKTYGGAILFKEKVYNYTNFHYRGQINQDLKNAIADHALRYIQDDQAIVLD